MSKSGAPHAPTLFGVTLTGRRLAVCAAFLLTVVCALLITTVAFAALYFHRDLHKLPKWPPPSMSPLGKYARAAVAADNEYCSEIGRNVLLLGGNAVDAAIAALFCIGVMDSHSAGLGGGHFMTIYNATTQKCHVIDARETAPAAATEDMYKGKWSEQTIGWKAIAVPGELHGLWRAYQTFGGRLPWKELIDPTIQLLEEGYPTSAALHKALKEKEKLILNETTMQMFINPATGKIFARGEQIKTRQNFVETLKTLSLAPDPVKTFYSGEIAEKIVKEFQEHGALITKDDLANYTSILHKGDDVLYAKIGKDFVGCGPLPPSGAAVALAILNILDGYTLKTDGNLDEAVDVYHRFIEAQKFSYAVRSRLGDTAFVQNASKLAKEVVTEQWAADIRSKIKRLTQVDSAYGGDFRAAVDDHGTTHISVVDSQGNAVSVTSTINLLLGAVVASPSTGIIWNDEMDDFSSPGHPNAFGFPPSPANFIRPGKRPQSSMSPLIIFNQSNPTQVMAVGGAGGSTIISGVAGVAMHALWLADNLKMAIDAPRLHNQLQPNVTFYEPNWPKEYVEALAARGHKLMPRANITVVTSSYRAPDGQVYANSDFRKGEESAPAGY